MKGSLEMPVVDRQMDGLTDGTKFKATINPKNMNDDRCFQYALTVALNYGKIKNHPERTKNIESFIDQYNWDEVNFLSD